MLKNTLALTLCAVFASVLTHSTQAQQQDINASSCDSKLISYLHWKETPATEWSLRVSANTGGNLAYIGASHSDDSSHPQFSTLREAWASQKPTIAFFEGPDRGVAETEAETIKKFGESGYVRFLAKNAGIKAQSLEPGPQAEAVYLLSLKKFTPEKIKLFFILREASRLREQKGMKEEQIKAVMAQLLTKANSMVPAFATVLPDIESIQPAYEKYWSAPANWWEAPTEWFTPSGNGKETGGKFTNDINRHSSEFRDLYMYRLLTDAVLQGEKVFAVVGRNHVPMQAEAIKCVLK